MNTIDFLRNEIDASAAAKIESAAEAFGDNLMMMSVEMIGAPSWSSVCFVRFTLNADGHEHDWDGIVRVGFNVPEEKFFTDRGETTIEAVMDRLHGKEEVA